MKVKILVCCHKHDIMATRFPYYPIQVGKEISKENLHIASDNIGDSISEKNASYCELTAMYWAWKNIKNVDYIGLCHYRRYFDFHNQTPKYQSAKVLKTSEFDTVDLSVPESILEKLEGGNIVLAKHETYRSSNFLEYCNFHVSDDLRMLQHILKSEYPEKYYKAFNEIMFRRNKLCPFNMFLMKKKDFDTYCEWLFGLLDKVENKIDISNYSVYQKRIFGFMAERLLNIYVYANNISVIEKPILLFDDGMLKRNVSFVKSFLNDFRANFSFMLIKPSKNAKF